MALRWRRGISTAGSLLLTIAAPRKSSQPTRGIARLVANKAVVSTLQLTQETDLGALRAQLAGHFPRQGLMKPP